MDLANVESSEVTRLELYFRTGFVAPVADVAILVVAVAKGVDVANGAIVIVAFAKYC